MNDSGILKMIAHQLPVKVGDIILPQRVAAVLKISIGEAKELLEDFVSKGYLYFEEGSNGKATGWHFTAEGGKLVS